MRTALSKKKEERYQTAAGLAGDLRRYLRHEPIEARPPSTLYMLRKFTRRNRAVVTGMCVAVVALVTAAALAIDWARVAEQQRDVAVTDYVFSLAFSPDGRTLLSGSGDNTIEFWHTVSRLERSDAARRWEALREAQRPRVMKLLDETEDPSQVVEALRSDSALSEEETEAALQLLLTDLTHPDAADSDE